MRWCSSPRYEPAGTNPRAVAAGRALRLHHDLTNFLRIADLTEFTGDGGALLREIKCTPRTENAQLDRAEAASNALMHGGDLPGGRPGARLVQLVEPYVTNLKEFGELLDQANEHGCQGMALSQGRALIASSIPACIRIWGNDQEAGAQAFATVRREAIEQAGIASALHHMKGISGDTAARQPILAPLSIYPFPPSDCAALNRTGLVTVRQPRPSTGPAQPGASSC